MAKVELSPGRLTDKPLNLLLRLDLVEELEKQRTEDNLGRLLRTPLPVLNLAYQVLRDPVRTAKNVGEPKLLKAFVVGPGRWLAVEPGQLEALATDRKAPKSVEHGRGGKVPPRDHERIGWRW